MNSSETVPNERFQIHFVRGWNKWIVVDLKYTRDNEVRNWKKKGLPGKQPIWKGTEEDAKNLAALLNKDAESTGNGLVKKAERGQSEWKPWQNKHKARHRDVAPVTAFKKCHCGTRYKGDQHCGQSASADGEPLHADDSGVGHDANPDQTV